MQQRRAVLAIFLILNASAQSPDWALKSHQAKEAMTAHKFDVAVSLYREMTQAFPDNPGLAMNLGLALHSASEYADAIREFE